MKLMLDLEIPRLPAPVSFGQHLLLIGSCFTEHMSERLARFKFNVLPNPHGILFNPLSVCHALDSYAANKKYEEGDLFHLNELWNSWDHHTRFSHTDKSVAINSISESQARASAYIRKAGWIMITLGSAFQYLLRDSERPVANNHRAPGQWFEKRLLSTDIITSGLSDSIRKILAINSGVQFLFTISPVRHIRDGVVDNNRSKARLIESVHALCERFEQAHYFPAYELVIDVLRDYRFYDIDFVHPNYLATQQVWEKFADSCICEESRKLMPRIEEIVTAGRHRPRFPDTEAHKSFKNNFLEKTKSLAEKYPFLDFSEELRHFSE